MAPDIDTDLQRSKDADGELEAQADELEERVLQLGDEIEDAKDGLRARSEEADEEEPDEEDDGDDDPLAFDDPEEDDEDEDI
jgi:uncharacterized membrane protein